MVKLIVLAGCLCFLGACTVNHTKNTAHRLLSEAGFAPRADIGRRHNFIIPAESKLYVAPPEGQVWEEMHSRDRFLFNRAVHASFGKIFPAAFVDDSNIIDDKSSAPPTLNVHFSNMGDRWLQKARSLDADFIVYPHLERISNNINSIKEWHKRSYHKDSKIGRDRVALYFIIADSNTGRVIDTVTINAISPHYSSKQANQMWPLALTTALNKIAY